MKQILLAGICLTALTALADPIPFPVAAASSSGTYMEGLEQIQSVCNNEQFEISIVATKGGATENLEQLVNNHASAAFLHSDVIYAKAQKDSKYRNYFTLVNLYPEEIHVLALRNSKETAGGFAGIGAKPVVYKSLESLEGKLVGAAGGSALTASLISGTGEGHFKVKAYDNGDQVMAALNSGEIQAAIFVGGAPLSKITALSADDYKLLPLGDNIIKNLTGDAGIYKPASLSYANLKSDSIGTVSTYAIILTRKYSTPKFVAPQKWFRNCFYEHLVELQETPNTHRKWQEVSASDRGVWQWYEFAGDKPALAPEEKQQ